MKFDTYDLSLAVYIIDGINIANNVDIIDLIHIINIFQKRLSCYLGQKKAFGRKNLGHKNLLPKYWSKFVGP